MNEENTATAVSRKTELIDRALKLNENGAHYFAGWLISAGLQDPRIMDAIERVLHEVEAHPALPHSCKGTVGNGDVAEASAEMVAPSPKEQQAGPFENGPRLVSEVPTPEDADNRFADVQPRPAHRASFPARLLEILFRKPRIAA